MRISDWSSDVCSSDLALSHSSSTTPARKQNYGQISSRDATVTGTERSVSIAGIDDMMDYQKSLKSVELRKDMEAIMLGNQGQNAGGIGRASCRERVCQYV